MPKKVKEKVDFWKASIVIILVWMVINTYYLNSLYTTMNLSSGWSLPMTSPQIEFPTSSTSIRTGYFVLAFSPLFLNVILTIVIIFVLLLFRKS